MEQNKIVTYYVIKDLATWTTRGCKQSVKWNLIIPCMTHRSIYWMAAG